MPIDHSSINPQNEAAALRKLYQDQQAELERFKRYAKNLEALIGRGVENVGSPNCKLTAAADRINTAWIQSA